MSGTLMLLSAVFLTITAMVHSWLGERLLIGVLIGERQGLLRHALARFVLRFAWHSTSVSWLLLAFILFGVATGQQDIRSWVAVSIGTAFLAMGIFDAFGSRGRHVGWPLLAAIGLFALASIYV